MVTIASWNVNSIKARFDVVTSWLQKNQPDFLLIQEIKCTNENFPAAHFKELGYYSAVKGQPTYHGVAVLSRMPVQIMLDVLPGDESDIQGRFIDMMWKDLHIINVYCPNGNPVGTEKFAYKLNWLKRLQDYCRGLQRAREKFLIGGDFNIIPADADAARPHEWINDALFQPEAQAQWRSFLNLGLTDAFRALHPSARDYTFWDYQAGSWNRNDGIRIDHFLLSPYFADKLHSCRIDKEPRGGEKPSDHTPIIVQFDL